MHPILISLSIVQYDSHSDRAKKCVEFPSLDLSDKIILITIEFPLWDLV